MPSTGFEEYQNLFHATEVDLLIPNFSSVPQDDTQLGSWWTQLESASARHTAFLDEKLSYFLALTIPSNVLNPASTPRMDDEPPAELIRFLNRLQFTMTVSLIPPFQHGAHRKNTSVDGDQTPMLAPPNASYESTSPNTPIHLRHLPPITPNPFPRMKEGEEDYAAVDGVVVWEGSVESEVEGSEDGRRVIKTEDGWVIVWRGEVPIAYVRTNIQNPLLSLTASVTLRNQKHLGHKKGMLSLDNASMRSGMESVITDGTFEEEVEGDGEADEMAGMEEIDLLGGLAGSDDILPASRLASTNKISSSMNNITTQTHPAANVTYFPPQTDSAPTTLRKSYRRVLSLSPGLRVRMRTLFLPQLLPVRSTTNSSEETESNSNEGEKKIVLIVEIENTLEPSCPPHSFEVGDVVVEVGGKGGKASAGLVCQPEGEAASVFPIKLEAVEQYNLLYSVEIASTVDESRRGYGQGPTRGEEMDAIRPVSITIVGRPHLDSTYPTKEFHSRWNCQLDLAPYHASLADTAPPQSVPIKSIKPPPNAIAGDKRYSLATFLADRQAQARQPPNRVVSGTSHKPLLPSQNTIASSSANANPNPNRPPPLRIPNPNANPNLNETHSGLLISVKILPELGKENETTTIRPLEPFFVEVFIHNRTEHVRRFRLIVPGREGDESGALEGKLREVWEKRRRRRVEEPGWGVDDSVLRQLLSQHLTSSPALIPLENDIRCGPLLPGSSISARIRFIALRDGVHVLDKLRVVGIGEDLDYTLSPVLDVVVGSGMDIAR